jgi:succinate-acetate transporter protein
MFIGTLRSNLALMAVFGVLFLTLLALTHEVRNEVVEELILVGGAKVMQNRTLSL